MNLKLLIDGRPLVGERTGIGVHTAEIAGRLQELDVVLATHAPVENLDGIDRLSRRVDWMPLGVLWQQLMLPRVAHAEDADVVWGPHGTLPLLSNLPAVVSLHDLTSITMPHAHRLKTILSFNTLIGQSLDRASTIMSVSRYTADQIILSFGIDPARIEVVPNGVSRFFSPPATGEEREPYILYVGTLEPRKGVRDLMDAWETLRHRPRLILAGSKGWRSQRLLRRIEPYVSRGEIEITGFVEREQLRDLYRRASLFVYPSHFEGFGLPVIEAMACGTPVITTTGGALPEAAGDAAVMIEPGDVSALAKSTAQLLESSAWRQELSRLGIEHASRFSWERSAALASEIFRNAAEQPQ